MLNYYDVQTERAIRESLRTNDLGALTAFASLLPQPHTAAQVLDAGCGMGRDLGWFARRGYQVTGIDASARMLQAASYAGVPVAQKDLRMLSLPAEQLDGIWCHRVFCHFPIEQAQRVLLTFFQGLKPRTGALFVSYLEGEGSFTEEATPSSPARTFYRYPEKSMLALLRQSGFTVLMQGKLNQKDGGGDLDRSAVICRRV